MPYENTRLRQRIEERAEHADAKSGRLPDDRRPVREAGSAAVARDDARVIDITGIPFVGQFYT